MFVQGKRENLSFITSDREEPNNTCKMQVFEEPLSFILLYVRERESVPVIRQFDGAVQQNLF